MKITAESLEAGLKFFQHHPYSSVSPEKEELINKIKNLVQTYGEINSIIINKSFYGDCGRNAMSYIGKLINNGVIVYSLYLDTQEVYDDFYMCYENIHFDILTNIHKTIQK